MFQFTAPEQAEDALLLATRDASASMRLTYDIEVWLPSIGIYKEVSSASRAGDYQARRAGIRYRPEGKGKPTAYIHTRR